MADELSDLQSEIENYEEHSVGLRQEDRKHTQSDDLDWFKAEQNRTYRIAIVYFAKVTIVAAARAMAEAKKNGQTLSQAQLEAVAKAAMAKRAEDMKRPLEDLKAHELLDLSEVKFHKYKFYYAKGVGYTLSRKGKDGAEADKVWDSLGEEKVQFSTVMLKYPANKNGEIPENVDPATGWEVIPWKLSMKTYKSLHGQAGSLRSNQINVSGQDIKIKCTNGEFQNFDHMESAGPALWRKIPAFKEAVLIRALPFYPKIVKPYRALSTADVRAKLGEVDAPDARTEETPDAGVDEMINSF